jgi:SAM-dependent methyltransferase
MEPYLSGEARARFDAWHAGLLARFTRDLTFQEIRKGVQALSSLYVGHRGRLAGGGASAFDGAGKRAGFALYFAPLHFLTVYHAVREIEFDALPFPRLWDLGCGTGAAGAAWATAQRLSPALAPAVAGPGTKIVGVDQSAFALEESSLAYRAFGLKGETRRIDLVAGGEESPSVVRIGSGPRAGGDRPRARRVAGGLRGEDAVILAYTLNEMGDDGRERILHDLHASGGTSRPLVILEPVAKRVAPWWPRWERALGEESLSLHSLEWRMRIELPAWIAEMDRAAGLDHGELTARILGVIG